MAGAKKYLSFLDAWEKAGEPVKRKYPQGWLNDSRWTDELEMPTAKKYTGV